MDINSIVDFVREHGTIEQYQLVSGASWLIERATQETNIAELTAICEAIFNLPDKQTTQGHAQKALAHLKTHTGLHPIHYAAIYAAISAAC